MSKTVFRKPLLTLANRDGSLDAYSLTTFCGPSTVTPCFPCVQFSLWNKQGFPGCYIQLTKDEVKELVSELQKILEPRKVEAKSGLRFKFRGGHYIVLDLPGSGMLNIYFFSAGRADLMRSDDLIIKEGNLLYCTLSQGKFITEEDIELENEN